MRPARTVTLDCSVCGAHTPLRCPACRARGGLALLHPELVCTCGATLSGAACGCGALYTVATEADRLVSPSSPPVPYRAGCLGWLMPRKAPAPGGFARPAAPAPLPVRLACLATRAHPVDRSPIDAAAVARWETVSTSVDAHRDRIEVHQRETAKLRRELEADHRREREAVVRPTVPGLGWSAPPEPPGLGWSAPPAPPAVRRRYELPDLPEPLQLVLVKVILAIGLVYAVWFLVLGLCRAGYWLATRPQRREAQRQFEAMLEDADARYRVQLAGLSNAEADARAALHATAADAAREVEAAIATAARLRRALEHEPDLDGLRLDRMRLVGAQDGDLAKLRDAWSKLAEATQRDRGAGSAAKA